MMASTQLQLTSQHIRKIRISTFILRFRRHVFAGILSFLFLQTVHAQTHKIFMSPPQGGNRAPGSWRELFQHPDQWSETRTKIRAIGYGDGSLSAITDNQELRSDFQQLRSWNLDLVIETAALKPFCHTGQECFDDDKAAWDHFESLGAKITGINMDEPLDCAIAKMNVDKCHFTTDVEYAAAETANFISLVRHHFDHDIDIVDTEAHPDVDMPTIIHWIDTLNAHCAQLGVRGIDGFALDLDWKDKRGFKPADLRLLQSHLQNSHIPFTMIYWAADNSNSTNDADWLHGIARQLGSMQLFGITPDVYSLADWLMIPSASVPETDPNTYAGSVLAFNAWLDAGSPEAIPGCDEPALSWCNPFFGGDDGGGGGGGGGGSCSQSKPTAPPTAFGPTGCFSSTTPRFSWSSVARATSYPVKVFEATSDPGTDPLLYFNATPDISLTLPFELASEKRYRWAVKGMNCGGMGPYSEMKYFTVSSNCSNPGEAPTLIGPQGCVDTAYPLFSWTAVARATGYRIVVSPADHDDFFIDQFVTGTSLVSPVVLNPRVQYRFKVRAVNDAGAGPWSDIMYFTPFCGGVASMITSPLGCINTTTPTFTWQAVPAAVDYWLLVADNPDFGSPSTTRFVDQHTSGTSLSSGVSFTPRQTYYAKVKTMLSDDSTTAAAWSATISFTPFCLPTPAPTGLSAWGADKAVGLTWTPTPGALDYNVKRSTTAGGPYAIVAAGIAPASYTDITVSNGKTYFYVVSAITSLGESPDSAEAIAVPSSTPLAPVNWINSVGVTVDRNNLSKSDPNPAWSAGAMSEQAIVSGDGYVEFTVKETSSYRMLGLSNGDTDQNYPDIDFALYPAGDGNLYVVEAGTFKASLGPYTPGDRLRVSVESGVVRYRRNGVLMFSSSVPPVYPLLADSSFYTPGATVIDAVIAGQMARNVTWTNVVGVKAVSTTLTKTEAAFGWNAGAVSTRAMIGGDGYMEFTATDTDKGRAVGLSHGDNNQDIDDIDYAIQVRAGGTVVVRENGVLRAEFGVYAPGDRFRIQITSGIVSYLKNGVVMYTSTVRPVYPLLVDTSFNFPEASISNVVIAGRLDDPL